MIIEVLVIYSQIWAEDGDSDDWHCVQTLGESNKY